jgi:branched-chain amino acid aminotransferase
VSADGVAFVGGRFVPAAEASVPVLDWGFLRSDATYDVVHVWRGRFFRLDDHVARFERSLARLRMRIPHDGTAVREILHECVRRAGLRDAYVEMLCTRGVPPAGSRDPRQCENRFLAFAIPFVWIADPAKQETGLHLAISGTERIAPEAVDPTVKNYHWLDLTTGLLDALEGGADTAVLVDRDGHVVEGPGFNVFAVRGGQVATPERGMLEGITRRTVLELAETLGIPARARRVAAAEVRSADEVFVTSTAGGVMPVTRVDGARVGDGRPGPLTRRLRDAYWAAHEDPRYATPVAYG